MRKIASIAWVTVREAIRQKLAVNLLVFAVALLVATYTISTLTFGEMYRVIVTLGLSAMEVFGTLIATFLGAGLIARDVERRSLYTIITKPVSRGQYVVGRFLGLVATTTGNLAVMGLVLAGVLAVYLRGAGFLVETPFLLVLLAMALQLAMVAALATLFSAFSTATLAAIFTLSLVVAGHVAVDMVRYWTKEGGAVAVVGRAAYAVLPNLQALDLKEAMLYKDHVQASFAVTGLGYGALYTAGVLALAVAVFSRRDLR